MFEHLHKYINQNINKKHTKQLVKVLDMFVKAIYVKHYMGDVSGFSAEAPRETTELKKFSISVKLWEFMQTIHKYIDAYLNTHYVYIQSKPTEMSEERYDLLTQLYSIAVEFKPFIHNAMFPDITETLVRYVKPGQTHLHYVE
jgi:hypothetical protein